MLSGCGRFNLNRAMTETRKRTLKRKTKISEYNSFC